MFGSILQDIRFGVRSVRTSPWLSLVTVLTLGLGIGASVGMFGVLHTVFLRPLPFPDPQELVMGRATSQGRLDPWVTGADYYDYRDEAHAFESLAAILPFTTEVTVSGEGDAERVRQNIASTNLFSTLGVQPAAGRTFAPEHGLEGSEEVVVLAHGFWQGRLGGAPDAVGRALALDGVPHTILGILPPGFSFMNPADLWVPMRPDRFAAASRDMRNWFLVGRLRPGVTMEQAQASVDVVAARLREAYPKTNADRGLQLTGLHQVMTEEYRLSLWILTGAVGLILLIACANGAGILLARLPARQMELAVRGALGAPRGRLARQLLAESLGLALAGGILGTALAIRFQGFVQDNLGLERLAMGQPGVSIPILAGALGASLLVGLLAGAYPALRSAGSSLTEELRRGGRGSGGGSSRFRSGLVVGQVALSVALLAGSGLLARSLWNLQKLDPGFQAHGLLTAEVQIPMARYPQVPDRSRFFSTVLEEARAIPGVTSAAATSHLPIGDQGNTYRASPEAGDGEPESIFLRSVFPGYFQTLGIHLHSGRDVTEEDLAGSPHVVILSQMAARRLFPGQDPLGKVVLLHLVPNPRPMEVVGVVGDARLTRLEEAPEAGLYVPYTHHPRPVMRVALQAQLPPTLLAGALRDVVRRIDPEVPLSRIATLEGLVEDSMAERRIITLSLSLLAIFPLLLASVGLFAVLAYHVSRRRHEMGVRMALGADSIHVGGLILRQGLGLVAGGVVLGLAGALAGTRLLAGMLFGVQAWDPATFLGVAGLVLGVGLTACLVPVWRALRADPRVALQGE
jgi:predicted permease